jgi:hypothetical protein
MTVHCLAITDEYPANLQVELLMQIYGQGLQGLDKAAEGLLGDWRPYQSSGWQTCQWAAHRSRAVRPVLGRVWQTTWECPSELRKYMWVYVRGPPLAAGQGVVFVLHLGHVCLNILIGFDGCVWSVVPLNDWPPIFPLGLGSCSAHEGFCP